jgi:hypothetical protein
MLLKENLAGLWKQFKQDNKSNLNELLANYFVAKEQTKLYCKS